MLKDPSCEELRPRFLEGDADVRRTVLDASRFSWLYASLLELLAGP